MRTAVRVSGWVLGLGLAAGWLVAWRMAGGGAELFAPALALTAIAAMLLGRGRWVRGWAFLSVVLRTFATTAVILAVAASLSLGAFLPVGVAEWVSPALGRFGAAGALLLLFAATLIVAAARSEGTRAPRLLDAGTAALLGALWVGGQVDRQISFPPPPTSAAVLAPRLDLFFWLALTAGLLAVPAWLLMQNKPLSAGDAAMENQQIEVDARPGWGVIAAWLWRWSSLFAALGLIGSLVAGAANWYRFGALAAILVIGAAIEGLLRIGRDAGPETHAVDFEPSRAYYGGDAAPSPQPSPLPGEGASGSSAQAASLPGDGEQVNEPGRQAGHVALVGEGGGRSGWHSAGVEEGGGTPEAGPSPQPSPLLGEGATGAAPLPGLGAGDAAARPSAPLGEAGLQSSPGLEGGMGSSAEAGFALERTGSPSPGLHAPSAREGGVGERPGSPEEGDSGSGEDAARKLERGTITRAGAASRSFPEAEREDSPSQQLYSGGERENSEDGHSLPPQEEVSPAEEPALAREGAETAEPGLSPLPGEGASGSATQPTSLPGDEEQVHEPGPPARQVALVGEGGGRSGRHSARVVEGGGTPEAGPSPQPSPLLGEGASGAVPLPGEGASGAVPLPGEGATGAAPLSGEGASGAVPLPGEGATGAAPLSGEGASGAVPLPGEGASGAVPLLGEGASGAVPLPGEGATGAAPLSGEGAGDVAAQPSGPPGESARGPAPQPSPLLEAGVSNAPALSVSEGEGGSGISHRPSPMGEAVSEGSAAPPTWPGRGARIDEPGRWDGHATLRAGRERERKAGGGRRGSLLGMLRGPAWLLGALIAAAVVYFATFEDLEVVMLRNTAQWQAAKLWRGVLGDVRFGSHRAGAISGRVWDDFGEGIAAAQVVVSGPNGEVFSGTADAFGNYSVEGVPEGSHLPLAIAGGHGYAEPLGEAGRVVTVRGGRVTAGVNFQLSERTPPEFSGDGQVRFGEPREAHVEHPQPSDALRTEFSFVNRGKRLEGGLIHEPMAEMGDGPFPILLIIFPGPASYWEGISIPLATNGYVVVSYFPTRLLDLEGDISDLDLLLRLAAGNKLSERGDGRKIGLLGGSMSTGYTYRMLLGTEGDPIAARLKASLQYGGLFDMFEFRRSWERGQVTIDPGISELEYLLMAFGRPDLRPEIYMFLSPNYTLGPRSLPPTFLVHAGGDIIVPAYQSNIAAERLDELGITHRLHIYEELEHYLDVTKADPRQVEMLNETLEFLGRYMR